MERPAAEAFAQFPFADPAEAHRLRLGPEETDRVAVARGRVVRPPVVWLNGRWLPSP
jgi:hypothetical protein